MNKLPEHISYSSFSTWQECGWKYKLTKVDQVGEGHAVWFTGGSALHKATEYYDLEGGKSEDLWNRAWFEQVKADEEINGDMSTWKFVTLRPFKTVPIAKVGDATREMVITEYGLVCKTPTGNAKITAAS